MRVYGLFYGGTNYAAPTVSRDTEEFSTLQEAKDTLWRRSDFDPYCPCVESPELHLYRCDPREEYAHDPMPDYVLTIGPRGGIIQSRV